MNPTPNFSGLFAGVPTTLTFAEVANLQFAAFVSLT
jgi:hypothetical protein